MASVRLEGLTRLFPGGVVAADGLDLEIRDGEFIVLLGPSGCGKTTTLRLIAGLEAPTSGRIHVGERDVTELPPRDRDVAMVFQNYALYPHMTVADNLAFGLRMRKTPDEEIRHRVGAAADILDIGQLLARKPAALSGGQRQRVALGRAIVREPAVFLFDEPLSNLDAKLRVHTRAELVRLHRQLGTTMIYVTHDQTEAMTMGRRIAVLDRGALQQVGAPLEVYDRPANLMVAAFIGSPPMNTFDGTVETVKDVPTFRGRSLTVPLPHLHVDRRRDVVLGVRPEDVQVVPDDGPGVNGPMNAEDAAQRSPSPSRPLTPSGKGRVAVVEPLGSETLLYCRTDADEPVIARTAERAELKPDAVVQLRVREGRAHLFDRVTGERLA